MNSEDNGKVTLAVLKKEIEHVSETLAELKAELKEFTKDEKIVHKEEFIELKGQFAQIQQDVGKLKSFHIYMVALASIVSPVILLVLRYFIGGLFGS